MELKVLSINGEETGKTVQLSDAVFGIEPNDHAIYLDVKQFLANQRQGTHKSKERAEISGSTRKIKKQKGTGTARAGSIKSPVFRGGGRVFGPRPRNYGFKLNKKLKDLARKSALSYKARTGSIVVVEDFNMDTPKTSVFNQIRKSLNLDGKRSLVVLNQADKNVYLASRNIPKSEVITLAELNTYGIMKAGTIVLLESSVEGLGNL